MAFAPQLAQDETVCRDINFIISKKPQVRLVLTSQALYWPGKKTFALSDAITTIRATPKDIEEVFIGRKSSTGSILGGVAMAVGGLLWTFAEYPNKIWFGYPQALIVGGVGVAIFGGRRFVLRIKSGKNVLKWTSPIAFGKAINNDIKSVFASVGEWCKTHGVEVKVSSKR